MDFFALVLCIPQIINLARQLIQTIHNVEFMNLPTPDHVTGILISSYTDHVTGILISPYTRQLNGVKPGRIIKAFDTGHLPIDKPQQVLDQANHRH